MSIMYCDKHDRKWDSDFLEDCPCCCEGDIENEYDYCGESNCDCSLAASCQCGAWIFSNGKAVHVADCICGAE